MDPLQSFLSSISPARAKSPVPNPPARAKSPPLRARSPTPGNISQKSRFKRYPAPSASSSNLLVPTPNIAGVSASASTSNLRSPSPTHSSRFGKMLAQPLFHLPRSRSPKPEPSQLQVPGTSLDSGSSTSLVAPSVPARSPLRGTPRSVASFSSLLDSYAQPARASRSGSTLGLGPTNEELEQTDLPSPSVYSPVAQGFPSTEQPDHRVRRSASMRLGHLRMPSTRVRSASVSSPMKYEDGADIPTPGRRSIDTVPQISRKGTSSTLPPIRDSAIGIKDLPPTPPPKLHVRMQSEFTLGPEFAAINGGAPRGISMVAGGSSPAESESSGFETAASHTNNTSLDTSVPPRSSRPGTSLSLNRPSTSASSRMVIQLPLPSTSTSSPSPAQESVGSPSTRTSTSQLSLLVESPERVYPSKRPDSTTTSLPEQKTSKRTHALLELLSSERAYASDLALIRDIFLPLAQGRPTTFPLPPSVGSLMFPMHQDPPMNAQDVKIVFGNIEELASFADELSEQLEAALGSVVPGGTGEDRVGELFCELAPRMTPMYLAYITRHPAAVARYAQLSTNPTPAMAQYLATTKAMTTSITHAWDIPSLIIKPLQRLLKYPLILQTILEHTPPSLNHPDRATLALAKDKTEQVARQVNEGKRRWEVVKGVLESGKSPPHAKSRNMFRPRPSANGPETGQDLVVLEKRVKECADGASRLAEYVTGWANSLTGSTKSLYLWSRSFQRVVDLDVLLGGDPQGGSEAVRAFSSVAQSLDDLSRELAAVVKEELVPQLHTLGKTSKEPLLLCAHAHTLAGAHYNLINAPYSKSRPSGLLEASQSYLALSAQLREELPRYIDMFERAFGIIVLRLSGWQARYFQESERRWREFWIALDVEGDTENTAAETLRIWWSRWEATARHTVSMAILAPGPHKRVHRENTKPREVSPLSDSASWDYVSPSALSFGDSHSRVSSDSPKSAEFPVRGKGKKSQKGGSNLRKVTDTLFGGTPSAPPYTSTPFPYSPPGSGSSLKSSTPRPSTAPSNPRTSTTPSNPRSSTTPSNPRTSTTPSNPRTSTTRTPSTHTPSPRTSHHPVLYAAAAIHPFDPATDATHLGLPFLKLEVGDTLEILVEAGHPKEHKGLPIPYDDAPDCMLAARSEAGIEGWALASYLMPLA